jgi:protein TonB
MSIGRIYTHNSSPALERRLRVRQRLKDLAYLDIGEENGGIVLNLTDEGMGLQAVAPLADHGEISLRIQLPRSRTRIETKAEIVWVSPEDRQAGVRFLNMPPEARVQIQKWVNSLLPPDEPLDESARKTDASADSTRRDEPARPPRKDKWVSLMAESQVQKQQIEKPLPLKSEAEPIPPAPIRPEDSLTFELQHNVSPDSVPPDVGNHAKHSEEIPADRPANKLDSQVYQFRLNVHPNEGAGPPPDAATGLHKPSGGDFVDWPIRSPQIVPPTLHLGAQENSLPPKQSAVLPVSSAMPKPKPAAEKTGTVPTALMPESHSHARKWIGAVILFAGISVACFGIGTWIGRRGSHPHATELPSEPTIAAPPAVPVPDAANKTSLGPQPEAIRQKVRTEGKRTNSGPGRRNPETALGEKSPTLESTSKPAPPRENPTPLTAGIPPEIRPTPTAMPTPTLAPTLTPTPTPAPAPAPNIQAAADSPAGATRIVAGRKLKPTDRYNSCYLTYRVEPEYPEAAKRQQIEGAVKIHQVISAGGSVQSVKLISGPQLLAPAALEAAKYWRYFPALLNGQPVEAELDVEIDFRLHH